MKLGRVEKILGKIKTQVEYCSSDCCQKNNHAHDYFLRYMRYAHLHSAIYWDTSCVHPLTLYEISDGKIRLTTLYDILKVNSEKKWILHIERQAYA